MIIKNPQAFADAFAASATADLTRPSIVRMRLDTPRLRALITRDLQDEIRGVRGKALFPNIRAFVRTRMSIEEARYAGGLSQWEILGTLINTAAKVGGDYAMTRINTTTQIRLQELAVKSEQLAQNALNIQAQRANLQSAVAEGLPQNIADNVVAAQAGSSGFPVIPVAIGVGILALGGVYFFVRRR